MPVLNYRQQHLQRRRSRQTSTAGAYDYGQNTGYNQYRAYVQDVWKVRPNFTLNYGLAWNAQTGFYNSDVPRPQYLAPILGSGNLGPTQNNTKEFQPAFGFAWSPFKDNKTVIRGGARHLLGQHAGILQASRSGLRRPSRRGAEHARGQRLHQQYSRTVWRVPACW